MSRVGKQLIAVPAGVEAKVDGQAVSIKGPLGTLSRIFPTAVTVSLSDGSLAAKPVKETNEFKAIWGTSGAHLRNMVAGVTKGFAKQLVLEGIGYKAALNGETVVLNLGFSHDVKVPVPTGVKVKIEKGVLDITGADKEAVGQFAAKLRALKPVEPYKGKGFRYSTEVVKRKQGKRTAA